MPVTTHEEREAHAIAADRMAVALDRLIADRLRTAQRPALYRTPEDDSPSQVLARSQVFKDLARYPGGRLPDGFRSEPVAIPGGLRTLITSADASAGDLVPPDHRGLLEPGLVRPLTIRQLLTVIPTTTDQVEYVKETSRVSAAAPVAEATAITGTSGTKPEGGLVFDAVTEQVRTIAVWVPATRRILSDASSLRAYVDEYLASDVALEVEDQVMSGNGTGENFTGIFNTTGTNTAGPPGAGESMVHVIREGIRLVQVNGKTNPTGIVVHPADAETLDLLQRNNEVNNFIMDPFANAQRVLFGVPLVISEACPTGFALVGDFRKAVLFDREETTIAVGTVADDFIRNIVRVLAESRAAFGVLRPAAFTEVDLVA